MITIERESWHAIKIEIEPLAQITHGYVEKQVYNLPLELDHDLFEQLDRDDVLHALVLRKDGVMIGFNLIMFAPLLRFKGKYHAYSDSIFVHPDHRKHSMLLITESEKYIKAYGCTSWVLASLDPENRETLWHRKGFKKAETIFIKVF